jgi:hypothetical protein
MVNLGRGDGMGAASGIMRAMVKEGIRDAQS